MAVIKVGNTSIGKVSVIQPFEDVTGKTTHFYNINPEPWVRPSEWLDMPSGDNTVAALIFVPSGAHDFTVGVYARGEGTSTNNMPTYIPVDWGDNTSGLIYGTRIDNSNYIGYFSTFHKMYDYDLLSSDTEIEIGGTTARQALIKLDGSVSGIGYFNLRPLAGNDFGYQNRRDETERKYEFYDTSGVVRTAPSRSGHRRNSQTSTLLEVYASGTSITGCKLSEDYPEGLHRYIEKAYLNIGNLGTDVDLFFGASNLQDVYFPYSATTGKTNFYNMFNGCRNLKSIPSFDTSSATSLYSTFRNCRSIKTVPNFDTSNVTNWESTFLGCVNIKKIPDLDFSSALSINNLFNANFQLTHIPSGFNAPLATGWNGVFYRCHNLVAVPKFDMSSATYIHRMYGECRKLQTPIEIDCPNLITNNNNPTYLFDSCNSLREVHIKNLGNARNFSRMFNSCTELRKVTWDHTEVQPTSVSQMFQACRHIKNIPELDFSEATHVGSAFSSCIALIKPPTFDLSKVQDSRSMFNSCLNLQEVSFKNVRLNNTENWNAESMFNYCENLESVSGLFEGKSSTPHYVRNMFNRNFELQDVSKFIFSGSDSTSTNNNNLFASCYTLRKLPAEINTERGCRYMFNTCRSIVSVPAYNLYASLDNTGMFNACNSLRSCEASGIRSSIGFNDCYLSSGAIFDIFNNLESVSSATIDIRSNYGGIELHADTLAIATNKGWTVLT